MGASIKDKVMFRIQRNLHNIQLRNAVCAFLRIFLPGAKTSSGNNFLNLKSDENQIFNDLKNGGFSDLGIALDEDQINAITKKLESLKCVDHTNEGWSEINLNNPGKDIQLGQYFREDLLQSDEILAIANDSRILNAVSKYLGVRPTISNVNCWWSFGDRESAKEAQFFHRDLDDFKFLKIFFYLTDVTEDSGPHIYVKGSHKLNKLLELRRFKDEEVHNTFKPENILTLTSPKGSAFIEDTYGIHKGQLPLKGNRLLLQIQYSYLPLHVEKYMPKKSSVIKDNGYDEYTNRLLFVN